MRRPLLVLVLVVAACSGNDAHKSLNAPAAPSVAPAVVPTEEMLTNLTFLATATMPSAEEATHHHNCAGALVWTQVVPPSLEVTTLGLTETNFVPSEDEAIAR